MMRHWAALLPAVGLLAATAPSAGATAPDPARCPRLEPLEEPLNDRATALPVPARHAAVLSSSRDRFAVATLSGGIVCVDTRPMTRVGGFTLSADQRFLAFDWTGYEADGHVIVDRSGAGQWIDTGAPPVASPSGRRLAAVQQSEAAFGALEGFGLWEIGRVGLRQIALLQDIPSLADWRIDRWAGESCVYLSGVAHERFARARGGRAKLPRESYVARPGRSGWALSPARDGCPSPK